jgi:hypothetical protein
MTWSTLLLFQYDLLMATGFSKLTNLFYGNTKYLNLNLNLNLVSYDVPDYLTYSNDVWFSILKLKKLHYLFSDLKMVKIFDPYATKRHTVTNWSWFFGIGRWWRDPSTNWSFFSKWSWNWFRSNPGPQTSGFSSTSSRLLCVQLPAPWDSQLNQLIETP